MNLQKPYDAPLVGAIEPLKWSVAIDIQLVINAALGQGCPVLELLPFAQRHGRIDAGGAQHGHKAGQQSH
jgi:hypothetical protein